MDIFFKIFNSTLLMSVVIATAPEKSGALIVFAWFLAGSCTVMAKLIEDVSEDD